MAGSALLLWRGAVQWDKEPAVAGGLSCYYARRSNCAASAGGQSRQWGLRGSVHPLCLVDFGNPNLALGGPLTWVNTGGHSLPWHPGLLAHPAANCVIANLPPTSNKTAFPQNAFSIARLRKITNVLSAEVCRLTLRPGALSGGNYS